jgi:hypothetical protein
VRIAPAHRLLAAFLALWLPFCCCQARAAARTVVHAMHGDPQAAACDPGELPSCCRGEPERDAGCCDDAAPGSGGAPVQPDPCEDCAACGAVKAKAVAPDAPTVEHDSVGTKDVALCTPPASDAGPVPSAGARWPHANAPPWRPGGRTALALHARLVI